MGLNEPGRQHDFCLQVWRCCSVTWPTSPCSAAVWLSTDDACTPGVISTRAAWQSHVKISRKMDGQHASLSCVEALRPKKSVTMKVCARSSPAGFCPSWSRTVWSASWSSSSSWDMSQQPSTVQSTSRKAWFWRIWCRTLPTTTGSLHCLMNIFPPEFQWLSSSTRSWTMRGMMEPSFSTF